MRTQILRNTLLAATTLAGGLAGIPAAHAQDATNAQINSIERQIHALQGQLQHMRQQLQSRDQEVKAAQQQAAEAKAQAAAVEARIPIGLSAPLPPGQVPPGMVGPTTPVMTGPPLPRGAFQVGPVTVSLGGSFVELAGIFRDRNEAADISSTFSGIPLPNSPNYYENEFRGSARQSRLALTLEGHPDDDSTLKAYYEMDFQSAAPTANSNQSNSYNLRIRQIYGAYDNKAWGLHVLAGQAWSMLTPLTQGIIPGKENAPPTIDAQYMPGFFWARQPQVRVVKDFDQQRLWVGLSLENPQTTWNTSGYTTTGGNSALLPDGFNAQITTPGAGVNSSTVNYSDNLAPDVILKAAWDPGWGHYEAFGIARFLTDRVDTIGWGTSNTVLAGGGGVSMTLPIIGKKLNFTANFLGGTGIGRYGSGGLPDATLKPDGTPAPIPEIMAWGGLIGYPMPKLQVYGLIGTEQESRTSFNEIVKGKNTGFGYGSVLYSNAGCDVELSPLTCTGNTSGLTQGTVGAYYKVLTGNFGTAQIGAQYSYTRRSIFQGTSATPGVSVSPYSNEQMVLVNFRYYPFQ